MTAVLVDRKDFTKEMKLERIEQVAPSYVPPYIMFKNYKLSPYEGGPDSLIFWFDRWLDEESKVAEYREVRRYWGLASERR